MYSSLTVYYTVRVARGGHRAAKCWRTRILRPLDCESLLHRSQTKAHDHRAEEDRDGENGHGRVSAPQCGVRERELWPANLVIEKSPEGGSVAPHDIRVVERQ